MKRVFRMATVGSWCVLCASMMMGLGWDCTNECASPSCSWSNEDNWSTGIPDDGDWVIFGCSDTLTVIFDDDSQASVDLICLNLDPSGTAQLILRHDKGKLTTTGSASCTSCN